MVRLEKDVHMTKTHLILSDGASLVEILKNDNNILKFILSDKS